jgi:serine/threonine protein kinase
VFSLGLTLYELLVGRPARTASETVSLIHQIAHEEVTSPRQLDRRVPKDLASIVLKATARDLSDRYPSAAALDQDLRAFLEDRPVAARRRSRLGRAWRWARRNRLVVALLVAVLAMLTVFLTVTAYR